MANSPKRHHYLPQAIQRNFLADGETMLWYYDRKADTYEQRTPYGIAQARNLYSYDSFDPEERYALEKAFSVLESKAAPAFLKLQKRDDISQEEHTVISEFVGMQYHRTPLKMKSITRVMDSGVKYLNEALREKITKMSDDGFRIFINKFDKQSGKEPSIITKEQFIDFFKRRGPVTISNVKNSQLSTLVDAGTHLGIKLSARKWIVLHTKPGNEFITSDVGLHLIPDGKPTRETGYGPGSPGMGIIFPFAKDAALMITSELEPVIEHTDFEDPFSVLANSGLSRVSSQLYSSDKELLEKLVKMGNLPKTSFEPIFDEEQMNKFAQKHFVEDDSPKTE